jgi:hypothetical protein
MAEVVRCPYLSSAQTTAQKGPCETAAMLQFQDGVFQCLVREFRGADSCLRMKNLLPYRHPSPSRSCKMSKPPVVPSGISSSLII